MLLESLQNSQENTCIKNNFIKKETLAQVFSCENLSLQNTFLYRTPLVAASVGCEDPMLSWFEHLYDIIM